MKYAILSGLAASLASVFGKLAFDLTYSTVLCEKLNEFSVHCTFLQNILCRVIYKYFFFNTELRINYQNNLFDIVYYRKYFNVAFLHQSLAVIFVVFAYCSN